MNEHRKRYLMAGVILGAITVGLTILARKTPREQWGTTLGKIMRDILSLVKGRYGNNEVVVAAEKALERFDEKVNG
jgi:C4-dicarboxylate-specific signal transduction histidine kinase